MLSLNKRALIAGSLIIAAFFALAGLSLQQAFDKNARSALAQRLLGQVYVLIAASRRNDNGQVYMPASWHNEKVLTISPNLMAEIQHGNEFVWQSPAIAELNITRQLPGQRNQYLLQLQDSPLGSLGVLSYAVAWGGAGDRDYYYFRVVEDLARYQQQRDEFTRTLWISLAGVALVLLLVQSQMLRWELAPLKSARSEIQQIQVGERENLSLDYPGELKTLTDSINQLLARQRAQISRYRHSLGDLAHSLKTPLAILQNALSNGKAPNEQRELLQQQLDRINQIASYQLARAATVGSAGFRKAVNVAELARSVMSGLNKVYAQKAPKVSLSLADNAVFAIEEGDFVEIVGNLLDNAYKWCKHAVAVQIGVSDQGLLLTVSDDGEGFAETQLQQGPLRGVRGDAQTPGHGLGLAMVADIIDAYHGQLSLSNGVTSTITSPNATRLGGACVEVRLPTMAANVLVRSA